VGCDIAIEYEVHKGQKSLLSYVNMTVLIYLLKHNKMWSIFFLPLASLLSVSQCIPTISISAPHPNVKLPLPARTVAQFDTVPTWLENIAVRGNGDLLVTQLAPAPGLYTIRNPASKNATLEPIFGWHEPNITDILGITETFPDTFNIIAGNATSDALGYAGTWSVWEARFHSLNSSVPAVRKITDIPEAKFLNGIVPMPGRPEIVFIADSQFGLLFRLDTRTGKHEIIAKGPEFDPYPALQNKTVGFGINGVKIRDGYLYFSNSNLVKIFRTPITRDGHIAQKGKAKVELYADLNAAAVFVDDFIFSDDGILWAASNYGNSIVAVSPGASNIQVVAGAVTQLALAGSTAAAFGRTKHDKNILYVCTAGGLAEPVNGTIVEPGKVEAIDTAGYSC
jgi:hypothetical protein